jgi:hypothetical protein
LNPKELEPRERALLRFYQDCHYGLSPEEFRRRYDLSYQELAVLCHVSLSTVKRLFAYPPRQPSPDVLRTLAIVDLLLRDQIPLSLIRQLCLPQKRQDG